MNIQQNEIAPLPSGEHPWAAKLRRARKLLSRFEFIAVILLTAFLFFSGRAAQWAESITMSVQSSWLQALLFSGLLGLLYGALSLPFAAIRSLVVERRFGLMTQTNRDWLLDQFKGLAIGIILGSIIILGLTASLLWAKESWWWVASLGALLFGVVLTRVAPQIIIPLFFKLKPIESQELQERFKRLAQKTNTPVLGIFEIDMSRRTRAANAAVVGFGESRKAIVGDTLLREFNHDEIEFVLAHELAHHRHHDLWTGIMISSALTFLSLWLTHRFVIADHLNGFSPVLLFWIGIATSVVGSILSPITKLFSRIAETRADRFAAKATESPSSGINAFLKLGYQNIAVFSPPRWEEILFHTHPCIKRRIGSLNRAMQTHCKHH